MDTTNPASHRILGLRELVALAVAAVALVAVSHLWDENKALRVALADEMRKSAHEGEANSNYVYLHDHYPGAERANAYTNAPLDVSTNLQRPTSVTLGVDWGKRGKCTLTAEAVGLLAAEAVFLKPRAVSCGGHDTEVDGLVFGSQGRLVHGQLLTIPAASGELIVVVRLAKDVPLDAWLLKS